MRGTYLDITLELALSLSVHNTDKDIVRIAKANLKRLPRSERRLLQMIIQSRSPRQTMREILGNVRPEALNKTTVDESIPNEDR